MSDRNTPETDDQLPPELRKLHDELSSIHIEERASFGPELRAELERIWEEKPEGPRRSSRRIPALVAAVVGGLILVSQAAPGVRASISELFGAVRSEVEALLAAPEDPGVPEVVMDRPGGEEASGPAVTPGGNEPREAVPLSSATTTGRLGENAFPDILDRRRAQDVIEFFYPDSLQGRGIGGTVELTLHVTPDGRVDDVRLLASSGVEALDRAALDAASLLELRPAMRAGEPTPVWVRFGVVFRPPPPDPETTEVAPPGR